MIDKYTVQQWSDFDGYTLNELYGVYGNDVIAFYAMEGSAVAGCEHATGTLDIFGAGLDQDNVTYHQMIQAIKNGI